MKKIISLTLLFFVFALSAEAQSILEEELKARLDSCLKQKLYQKVAVGVAIYDLARGHHLYARNIETRYIPASAAKIFASALAVDKFGPDHCFQTPVLTDGLIQNHALAGNLYLLGQGDPCLSFADLEKAAQEIKAQGIGEVLGDIVYDCSYLDEEKNRYAPNARNLYAPVCALTVNYGWIDVGLNAGNPVKLRLIPETSYAKLDYRVKLSSQTAWGRPTLTYQTLPWGDQYTIRGTIGANDRIFHYLWLGVSRPGFYAATIFKETLARNEIRVNGRITEGRVNAEANTLCVLTSLPLSEMVTKMNQESNNVIAETLNKDLGAAFDSIPGTREKGLQVLRKALKEDAGLQPDTFTLQDASGLSPQNRFSASHFIQALTYFYRNDKIRPTFINSLALQGHHPHARNPIPPDSMKIYVKSGTLSVSGVNTLVGYIYTGDPEEAYAFALLANRRIPGAMTYSGTLTAPLLKAVISAFKASGTAK